MPITLSGSGTVTGISAGGLPDGIIQSADLASGVGGKILQVVSAAKTDTASIASSGGNIYDISGLSVDITASATGNKMLIMAMVALSSTSSGMGTLLRKDSTSIFLGDAGGSRGRLTTNEEKSK